MEIMERKRLASKTNLPAGRACSAAPRGIVALHLAPSEFCGMASLLSGANDMLKRRTSRGQNTRCDGTFDEWRVSENDELALLWAKISNRLPNGQDRTPEIDKDDSTHFITSRLPDDLGHAFTVRPEATNSRSSYGKDRDTRACHLGDKVRCATGNLMAVRNEDQRNAGQAGAGWLHVSIIRQTMFSILERRSE